MNRDIDERTYRGMDWGAYEWRYGYYAKFKINLEEKHYILTGEFENLPTRRCAIMYEVDPNTIGAYCAPLGHFEGDICYTIHQAGGNGVLKQGRFIDISGMDQLGWYIEWIKNDTTLGRRKDIHYWQDQGLMWAGNIHDNTNWQNWSLQNEI